MAIKTDMLRYFVEVAHTGNLTDAAKNLGRTPSAVSMMLKQFEEHLGAPLFETERKNKLSALGKFTLQEAQRELFHFDQTVASIQRYAKKNEGLVRVASVPAVAATFIPEVLKAMAEEHPGIMLEFMDMDTDAIIAVLKAKTFDVGIVSELHIHATSNFETATLAVDNFGIVCRRDSDLGRQNVVHWSDLAKVDLIDNYICHAVEEHAVREAIQNATIQAASAQVLASLVVADMGVTVVPELSCTAMPGNLIFRLPEGKVHSRTTQLIWNSDYQLTPAVQIFCDKLRDVAAAFNNRQ